MVIDDRRLLSAFRSGDAEAFATLVQRHRRMVYGLGLAITRDHAVADDVCQEAFLALATSAHRVDIAVGAWLYGTARHIALHLRRRRIADGRPAGEPSAEDPRPGDVIEAVDAALAKLDGETRTILILRFIDERSQAEIAAELGLSQPTVCRRIEIGSERLRRELACGGAAGLAPLMAIPSTPPAVVCAKLGKLALGVKAGAGMTAVATMTPTTWIAAIAAMGIVAGMVALAVLAGRSEGSPGRMNAVVADHPPRVAPVDADPVDADPVDADPLDADLERELAAVDVAGWERVAALPFVSAYDITILGSGARKGRPPRGSHVGIKAGHDENWTRIGLNPNIGALSTRDGPLWWAGGPGHGDALLVGPSIGAPISGAWGVADAFGHRHALERLAARTDPAGVISQWAAGFDHHHERSYGFTWHPQLIFLRVRQTPRPYDRAVILAGLRLTEQPGFASKALDRAERLGWKDDRLLPTMRAVIALQQGDNQSALRLGCLGAGLGEDPSHRSFENWPRPTTYGPMEPAKPYAEAIAGWAASALGKNRLAARLAQQGVEMRQVPDAPDFIAWDRFMAKPGRDLLSDSTANADVDHLWEWMRTYRIFDWFPGMPTPVLNRTRGTSLAGDWALDLTMTAVDLAPWRQGTRGWVALVATSKPWTIRQGTWRESLWQALNDTAFGIVLKDSGEVWVACPGMDMLCRFEPELRLTGDRHHRIRLVACEGRCEAWLDDRCLLAAPWPGGAWRIHFVGQRMAAEFSRVEVFADGGRVAITDPFAAIARDGVEELRPMLVQQEVRDQPLLQMAMAQRAETVLDLLLADGRFPIEAPPDRLQTPPLMQSQGAEMIRRLIAAGAVVDSVDGVGSSALDSAVVRGNAALVRLLLQHGARASWDGRQGSSPAYDWLGASAARPDILALLRDRGIAPPALVALLTGDDPAFTAALDAEPAAIPRDLRAVGTLLHWAIQVGRIDLAQVLIDRGADINASAGRDGLTPLDWAVDRAQDAYAVTWLLDHGADPAKAAPGLAKRATAMSFDPTLVARLVQGAAGKTAPKKPGPSGGDEF